ncbi:MAG TPA: glycosyltransferase family 1 protein [Vicinamibacterales bacterium]|nr:glycosyltransferase family 1 protein [Vicinamibacterales bacterium]
MTGKLRVAVIADYLEEGWPSMDLVADMLFDRLQREHASLIAPTLIRPAMRRRASLMPGAHRVPWLPSADRIANRLWDYPRTMKVIASRFDLFHVVDHSYAQLVHRLPAERTIVTCHDLDTFRSVLDPALERRSPIFRAMTRHILSGLRQAGHIACDSNATRDALVTKAGIAAERTSVVPNGPHPSCTPRPEPAADVEAARLLGPRSAGFAELLHVGSTIARKRIDVLLRVFKALHDTHRNVRLVRVGGPFTAAQQALVRALGIGDAIVVLPMLDRATLASVYRRSALLLMTSEREGFGLPVLEAMACGTPVVASDVPAMREVGGYAASYCPIDDVERWKETVLRLLDERRHQPAQWTMRSETGIRRAAAFSWSRYASDVVTIYARIAGVSAGVSSQLCAHSYQAGAERQTLEAES